MEYNQDCAFNRIHILDETIANSDKAGCAIFNGGINVNKNIYAKEINCDYIEVKKIKVFDSIGIQNDIKIEGSIYPIDNISKSSLGSTSHKWNKLYLIDGNIQTIKSHNINTKNIKIENQTLVASIIDISNSYQFNSNFTIDLDNSIIYINVNIHPSEILNYKSNTCIIIDLPCSDINYEYHKIVLSQKYNYKIKWLIPGNESFISSNNNQIYDILNINDCGWKLTKYNELLKDNEYDYLDISNCLDVSYNFDISNCLDVSYNLDISNCLDDRLEFEINKIKFEINKLNKKICNTLSEQLKPIVYNLVISLNNTNEQINNLVISLNNTNKQINNLEANINCLDDKFNRYKEQNNSEIITINDLLEDLDKKTTDNTNIITQYINSNDKIIRLLTNEITNLKIKNKESNEKNHKLEEKLEKTDHKLKKILKYLKIE